MAHALRLAAQSQHVLGEHPQRSLLLALEALETTLRHGEPRLAAAETALRDGLAIVGGRPLPGHARPVSRILISPNGRWLASASSDRTVRLWDLTADDPAAAPLVLRGHEAVTASLAFSPDSRWLVDAGWDKVRLWDLTADDPAANPIEYPGPAQNVWAVAISGDHRWLATASWSVIGKSGRLPPPGPDEQGPGRQAHHAPRPGTVSRKRGHQCRQPLVGNLGRGLQAAPVGPHGQRPGGQAQGTLRADRRPTVFGLNRHRCWRRAARRFSWA